MDQPCSEKHLGHIAKELESWERIYMNLEVTRVETEVIKKNHPGDYEHQKLQVLYKWREKKGLFQGTFQALSDVFAQENDHRMVDIVRNMAAEVTKETSEMSIIRLTDDLKAIGYDGLKAAADNFLSGPLLNETLEDAPNDSKKMEVILSMLLRLSKAQFSQLIECVKALLADKPTPVQPRPGSPRTLVGDIDHQFRLTVRNIKQHLGRCDVQNLVTDFNMTVDQKDIPYLKMRVCEKLYKCRTVGDLFARLSPFISWQKRDVLRVLVEVSDSKEAMDELNRFEAQLTPTSSINDFPLPLPSNSICPDLDSDITMVTMKSNELLRNVSWQQAEHLQEIVADKGGIKKEELDLQAKNPGSSILYWLIPRSAIKTFEQNIRRSLDFFYEQGIVEFSFDPNIVITTGRKLRVRSLAYLTKVPPPTIKLPGRAEELAELPQPEDQIPERSEEIAELAYQLNKDVKQRVREIEELTADLDLTNKKVEELEQDNKDKEKECNQLKEQKDELQQIIEVAAQPRDQEEEVVSAAPPKRGFQCQQGVDLVFGTRGHTAVKCGDKVYIGGGVTTNADGAAPNLVQVIHLQDNNVSSLPACPVKHFSLVAINGQVVTVGGRNMSDDSVSDKLYSWNETSRQWEESLPHMLTPRYFNTSVVWQDFLITCGGRIDDEDSITDCVEVLNLRTLRWRPASPMPLKESGKHAVVTERGGLYLLGGYLGNAVHYCQLQSLVLSMTARQDDMWKRLQDTPSDDCAATLLDGSLVIIGGCTAGTNEICSTVQRYAQDTWQPVGDLSCGRTACVAIQLGRNDALVIGGTVSRDRPEWFSKSTERITL